MRITKTVLGVVAFLVLAWASWIAAEKANAEGVYVELGRTVFNSQLTTHALGYQWRNVGVSIEATGQGPTKRGDQSVKPMASVYHISRPGWRVLWGDFTVILGMVYAPGQKLVGPTNFRLEIVNEYPGGVQFFVKHISSAGLHSPNTGVDVLGLRKTF